MSMSRETLKHLRIGDYVKCNEYDHMVPAPCNYAQVISFDDPEQYSRVMVKIRMRLFTDHASTYETETFRLEDGLEDAIYRDGERLTFTEGV